MTAKNETKQYLEVALVIIIVLLILSAYTEIENFFWGISLVAVIALIKPNLFKYPSILWFSMSETLGQVVSKLLLTIVYFVFLFPMAVLFRIFSNNKELMAYNKDSMFITKKRSFAPKELERTF